MLGVLGKNRGMVFKRHEWSWMPLPRDTQLEFLQTDLFSLSPKGLLQIKSESLLVFQMNKRYLPRKCTLFTWGNNYIFHCPIKLQRAYTARAIWLGWFRCPPETVKSTSLGQIHSLCGFLECVDFSGFTPGKNHFLFKSAGGNFSSLQPHSRFISEQKVTFTGGPSLCPPDISRISLQSMFLASGLHCFRARVC